VAGPDDEVCEKGRDTQLPCRPSGSVLAQYAAHDRRSVRDVDHVARTRVRA